MKSTISTSTDSQTPKKTPRRIRGQGMTEYIIVVALVGLASVVAVGFFGDAIEAQFSAMAYALSGDGGEAKTSIDAGVEAAKGARDASANAETLNSYAR